MHEALILFISTQQGSNLDTFRVKLSNTPVILLIHSAARSFIFRKKPCNGKKLHLHRHYGNLLSTNSRSLLNIFLLGLTLTVAKQNWSIAIILIVFRLNNQKILLT